MSYPEPEYGAKRKMKSFSENPWMEKLAIFNGPKAVQLEVVPYPKGVLEEEEISATIDVLRGGRISGLWTGTPVDDFEESYAKYVGTRYALAANSGTAALHSAIVAARAGPGDEVIVPAYTYLASVSCVLHNNAVPIFADVDSRTFTLDPEDVETKITKRTRAIVAVHLYGHPAPMDRLCEIAKEHDLIVIEDCAQAIGAEYNGMKVGSIGDIGCTSFQASKNMVCGEGGMLTTNSEELLERAALTGNHPWKLKPLIRNKDLRKYVDAGGMGYNYRMHPMLAAIGLVQLKKLDDMNDRRIRNANYLTERLKEIKGIEPPYVAAKAKHVYYMYTMKYDEVELKVPRERYLEALVAEGVPIFAHLNLLGPYVEKPLYEQAIYKELDFYGKGCPFKCHHGITPTYGNLAVTERLCKETFSIFDIHPPNSTALMAQYVHAFEKVSQNVHRLSM